MVFNILIKPFDLVILEQYLDITLNSEDSLDVKKVFNQKNPGWVELIKDIQIDRLTELGFRTVSKRPIEVNKLGRYFGPAFGSPGEDSLFAYCYKNIPSVKGNGEYSSSFSFYGLAKDQLNSLRRFIQQSKDKTEYKFEDETSQELEIVHFSPNATLNSQFEQILNDKFEQIYVRHYRSLGQMLQEMNDSDLKEASKDLIRENVFESDEDVLFILDEKKTHVKSIKTFETQKYIQTIAKIPVNQFISDSKNFSEIFDLSKVLQEILNFEKGDTPLIHGHYSGYDVFYKILSVETLFDSNYGNVCHVRLHVLNSSEEKIEIQKKMHKRQTLAAVVIDGRSMGETTFSSLFHAAAKLYNSSTFKKIILSEITIDNYNKLEKFKLFDDIFPLPIDIFYMTRKLKMHIPQLKFKSSEDNHRWGIMLSKGIKTGWPLELKSISEVHVSFEYPREIRIGDVRRFILPLESPVQSPEILAICRFCKKISEDKFSCDFLFFAVKDSQIKHIRSWIKTLHIQSKNQS